MQIPGYNLTKRVQGTLWDAVALLSVRERTSDDYRHRSNGAPAGEQPAFVRVVLEYTNGAVVSKDFTTAQDAMVFLERHGSV